MGQEEAKVLRKGLGVKKKGMERTETVEIVDLGESVDQTLYQRVVGTIMFAALTTRPDLAFPASVLAQFNSDPRVIHLQAAKRTLRYGIDTAHMVLRYEKEKSVGLQGYTDSDYAGEAEARSRGAYVFLLAGATICWKSKKQVTLAKSKTEAEYIEMSDGAQEAVWLRRLLSTLGWKDVQVPVFVDNLSAISLAHNPVMHSRTKHIEVHWHFVRQAITRGEILVQSVRSKEQLADFLTKAVNGKRLWSLMEDIGFVEGLNAS